MEQVLWADRGRQLQLSWSESATAAAWVGLSRQGAVQMAAPSFTVWVQLRGSSTVDAKEGRFQLRRGSWIALERDSRPLVQADRQGLCVGLMLDADTLRAAAQFADCALHAGRGELSLHASRTLLRLWRQAAAHATREGTLGIAALRPLLLQLGGLQSEYSTQIARCPGRSRHHKVRLFARLQRARLYLEGNADRIVRIDELAALTSFSSCYFSKIFLSLYGETPQAAAARLRLERAADLLRGSSMMIGEVATASGFDNCCSFARAFRSRYGVSARRYRTMVAAPSSRSAMTGGIAGTAVKRAGTH